MHAPSAMPAMIDSKGNPGIIPPGVVCSTIVNVWPLLATVIVWLEEIPFLLIATEYVPAGRVKVTVPCALVVLCSGPGTQGVGDVGLTTTVAPDIGLPCASLALIVIVTFGPQVDVAFVAVEIVVVLPVVNVDTVDMTIEVEVVENTPPNAENLNMVESGVL